jgi:predicted ribosome quality control (RQC) complex YloA/Tae2 family protein
MSNFDIAVLLNELSQSVIGSRINNIYQINELSLFKLSTKNGDKMLLMEPGRRIHLTRYVRTVPKTPSNFCAALRKHIRNGRIENIAQHDLDRIVSLTINAHSNSYRLVLELFGEGNLILCDSEDRIVLARHYKIMRDRSIKPRERLAPPPPRGTELSSLSEDLVISIIEASSSGLVETLASSLNLDPLYAEEICSISGIEKSRKARDLEKDEKLRIAQSIRVIFEKIRNGPYEPRLVTNAAGEPVSTAPFQLTIYDNLNAKKMDSYNDALDDFFSSIEVGAKRDQKVGEHESKIEGIQVRIKEQQKKIDATEELQKKYRKSGDLIYLNLSQVDEILSVISSARKKGVSWSEIEEKVQGARKTGMRLADKIISFDPKEGTITLELDEEKVEIDIRLSAGENASRYYEAAKKAESKRKGAESALKDELEKIKELESHEPLAKEEALREKREKKWYERYRWFISSDDFLVIGGRDLRTNEILVKKMLKPSDIFVHADVHGAPVVIVKSDGKEVPEATKREACLFSVSYSRLWKSGVGAGDAYWAKGEQVSLTPPSGEYLQKGSFIVKGQRNYVKGLALRISIGIVVDNDGHVIPVAGPTPSVLRRTRIMVELIPGGELGSKLAGLVKRRLVEMVSLDLKPKIEQISIDEFLLILPPGAASIVK